MEGFTDIKFFELKQAMCKQRIAILCIQETRIKASPHYVSEDGFTVILSGSTDVEREFAGVGFIVAPWARSSVVSFLQWSNRLASLKIRVPGGVLGIVGGYAPHSGYPFDDRQKLFDELGIVYRRTSVNGLKMISGDMNAR